MKVLVSALEPSSNLHLKELLKHAKGVELVGIFSKELGNPLYDISEMAIMGFVDAFKKYRWFKSVAEEMVSLADDVDRVLLMDSSGFNLPLAKKLKRAYPDKEIIYYILPQVWASRSYRTKALELYCDKLFGILPFEMEFYTQKAQYVGHPLLDEIRLKKERLTQNGKVAFMPGSRRGEISKLFPIYRALRQKLDIKEALLIIPASFSDEVIKAFYGDTSGFNIVRESHPALYTCDFAFICSGTATLEAALIGTPFSLSYIAKPIDYLIAKYLLKIKQIGLANIILTHHNQTTLHKELIQDEVTVENLLDEYYHSDREAFLSKALELRAYLGDGSSQFVGEYISSYEFVTK